MSDIDKDVDVVMDRENHSERNIIAHIDDVGREIVTRTNASIEELKVSSSTEIWGELRSPYQE